MFGCHSSTLLVGWTVLSGEAVGGLKQDPNKPVYLDLGLKEAGVSLCVGWDRAGLTLW